MRFSIINLMILIVILAIISMTCFYTVKQYETAMVLHFGKVELNKGGSVKVVGPGLHMRWPFVDVVKPFDMRIRTLNVDSPRVMTAEQKEVSVDAYVKWRIADVLKYYKATGSNAVNASQLLTQNLNDSLRNEFGSLAIPELIDTERSQVMQSLQQSVNKAAATLGIDVVDVRIKKIELPQKVQDSVFERMRSKRENKAATLRAEGQQAAEQIKADADAQATVITATAKSDAAKIRAKGTAEAAGIYAKAYSQDPTFFVFYRSLEAYQQVFAKGHANLVLKPNSQFFKYFNSPDLKIS